MYNIYKIGAKFAKRGINLLLRSGLAHFHHLVLQFLEPQSARVTKEVTKSFQRGIRLVRSKVTELKLRLVSCSYRCLLQNL
jgi:hypothetical protein